MEAHTLQLMTAGLGTFVITVTVLLLFRFALIKQDLSRAFALNLGGEFVAGLATTFFTIAQLAGPVWVLRDEWKTAIRLTMFLAMLASSLHMALLIRRLENQNDEKEQ